MGQTPFRKALVICDSKLKTHPSLQAWQKNSIFSFYFVSSGEGTKSIEHLSRHLKNILSLCENCGKDHLVFISVGGGSLGDLTGFLSSIYKRGVPLIHIPTTWLAALDSAHGGKNALNFSGIKNVVGTYHFPQAVFIVEEVLKSLPLKQKRMAFGELLKIALIEGGSFYKSLKQQSDWRKFSWEKFLKQGIASKIKIVRQDPFEKKSLRRALNFGHTVGHILEAAFKIPHGQAVMQGMLFSMEWSARKNFLNKKELQNLRSLIPGDFLITKKIPMVLFKKLLRQDKKYKDPSCLEFVFIHRPGTVTLQRVKEREILQEAQRQGLVRR